MGSVGGNVAAAGNRANATRWWRGVRARRRAPAEPAMSVSFRQRAALASALVLLSGATMAAPSSLYADHGGSWIADHHARAVGDVLTVLVHESSSARNTTATSLESDVGLNARLNRDGHRAQSFGASVGTSRDGGGRIQRAGNVLAQLSTTIEAVLPNGDLRIGGEQAIDINGEVTRIRVHGRVRPVDIEHGNVVWSSRVADARIDYVGEGAQARRSRPGLISWLLEAFRPW